MRGIAMAIMFLFFVKNNFGQNSGGDLKIVHLTGDFYC